MIAIILGRYYSGTVAVHFSIIASLVAALMLTMMLYAFYIGSAFFLKLLGKLHIAIAIVLSAIFTIDTVFWLSEGFFLTGIIIAVITVPIRALLGAAIGFISGKGFRNAAKHVSGNRPLTHCEEGLK